MKKTRNVFISLLVLSLLLGTKNPADAVSSISQTEISVGETTETTPISEVSCLNPTGSLRVNYSSGNHGIVGDSNNYSGSDAVYQISSDQLMQCFCAESGTGIQTDWKKVVSLQSDEAKVLKNQGWIEVPSGQPWGLDDAPYMAYNLNYTCKSHNPGGPGDGRSDGRSDGKSDGRSSYVQSAKGLASTGNVLLLISLATIGSIFVSLGLILKKKE